MFGELTLRMAAGGLRATFSAIIASYVDCVNIGRLSFWSRMVMWIWHVEGIVIKCIQ